MQNDNSRGSLGSKFEGFGAAPSEGLWGSIADSLDGKKKRKFAIWWWLGAAAVTLVAVGVFLTSTMDENLSAEHNSSSRSQDKHIMHVDPSLNNDLNATIDYIDPVIPTENEDWNNLLSDSNNDQIEDEIVEVNTDDQTDSKDIDASSQLNDSGIRNDIVMQNSTAENLVNDDTVPSHSVPLQNSDTADENALAVGDNVARKIEKWELAEKLTTFPLRKIDLAYPEPLLTAITANHPKSNKWEMGLSINRWSAVGMNKDVATQYTDASVDSTMVENSLLENINNNYDVSVQRPIGIKYHVGYQLTQRLRIVSGISAEYTAYRYSTLSINTSGVNEGTSIVGIIPAKLTNIGIPIGLEFDFIDRRRFKMGTGFSILNELPFLETYRPSYDLNYEGNMSNVRNLISGYNFGVNLNLNASMYITEKMRIQANPGLRWYGLQESTSSLNLQKRSFWLGGSLGLIWDLGR